LPSLAQAQATLCGIWNLAACAAPIKAGQDALAVDSYGAIDAIITNPPYTRDLMHKLIAHFSRIAPTWLLLESDWAQTKQSVPFMPSCSDIVAIGRVKWIEGSKHTGKDNSAWYRFDSKHASGPAFHARGPRDVPPVWRRICDHCGRAYTPRRSTSRFCKPGCRVEAFRKRLSVTDSVTQRASNK
jgi:hypothetical protein